MRNNLLIGGILFFMVVGLGCNRQDPAAQASHFQLKVERFDSAFFSMDTLRLTYSLDKLRKAYPNFCTDFITRILMLKNTDDTLSIKAYYKTYFPIYKEVQNVNAIKVALPALEEAFKRLHYYFPKYTLTHNIILFVGPLESYGNIVTTDGIAIGLQMHMGMKAKWYYEQPFQTLYPPMYTRTYTPDFIAISSVHNILNDIYGKPANARTLMEQMVEAGKIQYVVNACFPNTPDSIRMGFTNEQCLQLKKQEAQIWTYLLHEKLCNSTNQNDLDNLLQEGEVNNLFGESLPGNVGKFIGLQLVTAWMHQNAQKETSLETMLNTDASKIVATVSYAP